MFGLYQSHVIGSKKSAQRSNKIFEPLFSVFWFLKLETFGTQKNQIQEHHI